MTHRDHSDCLLAIRLTVVFLPCERGEANPPPGDDSLERGVSFKSREGMALGRR